MTPKSNDFRVIRVETPLGLIYPKTTFVQNSLYGRPESPRKLDISLFYLIIKNREIKLRIKTEDYLPITKVLRI